MTSIDAGQTTASRDLVGVALLLTIALVLRILWVSMIPNEQVADFASYNDIAFSLVRGLGYVSPTGDASAFKPIGYPLFLAGVYRIFGESTFVAKIAQANVSVVLCYLIFIIARSLFGRNLAFIAMTFAVLHPSFIFTTSILGTETVFTCLLLGTIALLVTTPSPSNLSRLRLIGSGILLGTAALVRPTALLFPFALVLWLMSASVTLKRAVVMLVFFSLGVILPVAPWTLRNYSQFQRIVPISTNGGANLLYGHNPLGTNVWIPFEQLKRVPRFPIDTWATMNEPEQSHALRSLAIEYIVQNPVGVFTRMPEKFYKLLLSPEVPHLMWNIEGLPESYKPSWDIFTFLGTLNRSYAYAMLFLAIIGGLGIFAIGPRDHRAILPAALIVIWISFHLLFWAKARFRFPIVAFFVIFAAWPFSSMTLGLKRYSKGKKRRDVANPHC